MKLSDLRPCDNCGSAFKGGIFHVVRESLAIVNLNRAQQFIGMTQFFNGSQALASVFTDSADAVTVAGDKDKQLTTEVFLCQDCFMTPLNMAILFEKVARREEVDGDASI